MSEFSGSESAPSSLPAASESSAPSPTQESGSQGVSDHRIGESASENVSKSPNGERREGVHKESRYERTKRERAQLKAQQAQFAREREAFAREREAFVEQQKPKRDYTLADLKKYRGQWANEGNYDLVQKADREIGIMEAEEQAERAARTIEMPRVGSPQHAAAWHSAEQEIAKSDPDFLKPGTRLDTRLREIMGGPDGDIYRQHPRGIVAAYHRAKMELLEADFGGMRTENSKLKNELQRLTGLTSIDGGAPGSIGRGTQVQSVDDFARLSTKDMRKHLERLAKNDSSSWF